MNSKILKYELKRIIFSKVYIIIFLIAALFSVIDLYSEIIQGVSGTAPFSKWSYCKFLCDINTIILLILMLLCTEVFSKNEQRVREITSCTSLPKKKYFATKSLAIVISCLIIMLCCILISLVFYKMNFEYTDFKNFLSPILVISVPTFIFVFGISMFLGRKSQILLYILIPIVLVSINIFTKGYVVYMPKVLPVDSFGETIFSLSLEFVVSRLVFTLIGIAAYAISYVRYK